MSSAEPLAPGDVLIGSFEEAARAAVGTAVVIDVFRAFTTAATCLANGAGRIVMVGALEEARTLRERGIGTCLIGERGGIRPDGFDFGNSPAELAGRRFAGETVIQTTSNGTRGIVAAGGAARIYAGAFATAGATARAIRADPVLPVTLVAMGEAGPVRRDEDEICALYLRALLCGRSPDTAAVARLVATMADPRDTRRLSDEDVAACLTIDSAPFAIRVEDVDRNMVARRE